MNNKEERTHKQIISKFILIFLISMGVFTLFTQKVSYIMTSSVEVVNPRSGDLKSNPNDPISKSLGYYTNIIPTSCIHQDGPDSVIYTIAKEKSKRQRDEAVKMVITVIVDNGIQAAIQGGFSQDVEIIKRSTRPLMDGMVTRVLDIRGDGYGE